MSEIDLTATIGNFLKLRHPFWIASAHYSMSKAGINSWIPLAPAALTLKTSHNNPIEEQKRLIRKKTSPSLDRFGKSFYCDGPKHQELLTYDAAASLLAYAKEKLPETKVGISVIGDSEQDYDNLWGKCQSADFCELNLKYSFRLKKKKDSEFFAAAKEAFVAIVNEVSRFTAAFRNIPIVVKISRELSWLPGTAELDQFLSPLVAHGSAALLVANSLKLRIPTFLSAGKEENLDAGVICGENLFDQTITLIEELGDVCKEKKIPIIATGGMIDPEHILLAMRGGAGAVQLCTAFEYYGLNYYNTLCWNLQNRIETRGLRSFSDYLSRIRNEGVASIYNMPFMYFERFNLDEVQKRIATDIRRSTRMDVLVMSGKSISDEWSEHFKQRFKKNLGLRLLLPNPEGAVYTAIQESWGISKGPALDARKMRILEAKKNFETFWGATDAERKQNIKEGDKESQCEVVLTAQCPFYSFYLFDDKVYVAPYPFSRPGELQSPVYVFFAGSSEFDRIRKEADLLFEYARQTKVPN